MEVFKRAIMQPGPPEHFALLTVLEFIKPQWGRKILYTQWKSELLFWSWVARLLYYFNHFHTYQHHSRGQFPTPSRRMTKVHRIGYIRGEHCLDNLNDLLRFLWRDDPQSHDEFKQVRKWNKASKDLIPIIEHYQEDQNLLLNAGWCRQCTRPHVAEEESR